MANKRLGRGLRALIPEIAPEETEERVSSLQEIDVRRIKPNPFQPRANYNEAALEDLKNSIAEKGIIQPLSVRRAADGYELIAGERRLRAVTALEIDRVPAYILEVESDEDMLELSLIENIQREDLNPIDIARAYQKLITDCNLTQEQVSQRVGKDRSTVANFLRLLKLPDKIQDSMRRGELEMGHGRALITIENKDLQNHLWQKIVKDKISVRQVEKLAKVGDKKKERAKTEAEIPYFIIEAEERLRTSLGTQVKVKHGRKGGIIEIEYYSDSDLERLLELLP